MQKGIGVTWCYEQMKPQNSNFRDVGNVYARSLIALAPRYRSNLHPFATHRDWKRTEKRLVPLILDVVELKTTNIVQMMMTPTLNVVSKEIVKNGR